jgi:hypothetical protein
MANQQITRTERLLQTLPAEQRSSFESLAGRRVLAPMIQAELDQLHNILKESKKNSET